MHDPLTMLTALFASFSHTFASLSLMCVGDVSTAGAPGLPSAERFPHAVYLAKRYSFHLPLSLRHCLGVHDCERDGQRNCVALSFAILLGLA